SYWVEQSVRRALARTRAVHVPAYALHLLARWRRAAARLRGELGRGPTPGGVAAAPGLGGRHPRIVPPALRAGRGPARAAEGGPALEELLPDSRAGGPRTVGEAEELARALGALAGLNPRAAEVLRLRFGLGGGEGLTLAEVGARLGVTR